MNTPHPHRRRPADPGPEPSEHPASAAYQRISSTEQAKTVMNPDDTTAVRQPDPTPPRDKLLRKAFRNDTEVRHTINQ